MRPPRFAAIAADRGAGRRRAKTCGRCSVARGSASHGAAFPKRHREPPAMNMKTHATLLAGLLATTAVAQQPAKIPAAPSTGPDVKTAAEPSPKVERLAAVPRHPRPLAAPAKVAA